MGWESRKNVASGLPRLLATRLSALRAVVDVQHLYRTGLHAHDRGTVYALANGTHIAEADAAIIYAAALTAWLKARGASVLTNDPVTGALTGPYSRRNLLACQWGADCYLACHLNAGGGSYAALEYMAGTSGDALASSIGRQIVNDFPLIGRSRSLALNHGQRGAVCIEGVLGHRAAVILEPFFGDTPAVQGMFAPTKLHQLGETIGEGIAQWWERRAIVRVV